MRWLPAEYKSWPWWVSYLLYLAFTLGLYYPAKWLLYRHSHAAFWVAWGVILLVGVIMMNKTERRLKARKQ